MGAGGWLVRLALLGALLAAARGARLPGGGGAGPALKKDVFASRGWGAGGMPFSVLYLNPQQAPPAPPAQPPAQLGPPLVGGGGGGGGAPRALAQRHVLQQPMAAARTMGGGGGGGGFEEVPLRAPARRHYSIIPQLFVSYGWGPLGK